MVRGRALWRITYLGSLLDWLQWPRSFVVLGLFPGLLLALLELRTRIRRRSAGASVDRPMTQAPAATTLDATTGSDSGA